MPAKVNKTDDEWRSELTPEQYEVLRRKGTERPWSNEYNDEKGSGTYRCAGCGAELFSSDTKFESGTGWPSFYAPAGDEAVEAERDMSHGMIRTRGGCASCGGPLRHGLGDRPNPSG